MSAPVQYSQRGFKFVETVDAYGERYFVRESSAAGVEMIWLGDAHLTRERVAEILPFLTAFVEEGWE